MVPEHVDQEVRDLFTHNGILEDITLRKLLVKFQHRAERQLNKNSSSNFYYNQWVRDAAQKMRIELSPNGGNLVRAWQTPRSNQVKLAYIVRQIGRRIGNNSLVALGDTGISLANGPRPALRVRPRAQQRLDFQGAQAQQAPQKQAVGRVVIDLTADDEA